MRTILALGLLMLGAISAQATTINVTLTTATGSKFNGLVTVIAPDLKCGTVTLTRGRFPVTVTNGVFSITLQDNDSCEAGKGQRNTYTVTYEPSGSEFPRGTKWTEEWAVPAAGTINYLPRYAGTDPAPIGTISLVQLKREGAAVGDYMQYSPDADGVVRWHPATAVPGAAAWSTMSGKPTEFPQRCNTSGTSTAYTCAPSPAVAAYTTGQTLTLTAHTANATGPVTLNVNGLGSKAIKKLKAGVATDLAAGDLSTAPAMIQYDGTQWLLVPGDWAIGAAPASLDWTSAYSAVCWGDSMCAGATNGSVSSTNVMPAIIEQYSGMNTYQRGVGGETSTQVRTRFDAAPETWGYATVFWVGRNDYTDPTTVKANIAYMVGKLASVGNTRYVVVSILNSSAGTSGSAEYSAITALNADLAAAYPGHYYDARSYLVSQYNASIPQDVTDHTNDVPPSSLRLDTLHPNAAGYAALGAGPFGVLLKALFAPINALSLSQQNIRAMLFGTTPATAGIFARMGIGTTGLFAKWNLQNTTTAPYIWMTDAAGLAKWVVLNNGRWGINTDTPAAALEIVFGNASAAEGLRLKNSAGSYAMTIVPGVPGLANNGISILDNAGTSRLHYLPSVNRWIFGGGALFSTLTGTGNAFACIDSTGLLYRSATACN